MYTNFSLDAALICLSDGIRGLECRNKKFGAILHLFDFRHSIHCYTKGPLQSPIRAECMAQSEDAAKAGYSHPLSHELRLNK